MTELDELKRIIFGDEQRSINALQQRVTDRHKRAQDVAEILPESIAISSSEDSELINSLQAPVTECIKVAARQETHIFADSLFPVIMPAIRKAIAEALRSFVQSINKTLEQSLSLKWLRWRFEAIRTGVPFHEVVLKHTLIYCVEQVFLIHRETGLLIGHVSHPDVRVKDSDAVSAMFTAIQDFVRESFNAHEPSELDSMEFGDHEAWLFYSPYVTLACVIRGIAPLKLKQQFTEIIEDLDRRFSMALEHFDGDRSRYHYVQPILEKCLKLELKSADIRPVKSTQKLLLASIITATVITIVGLPAISWLATHYESKQSYASFHETLEKTPGIVIIDTQKQGNKFIIKGLRDPLAVDPIDLLPSFGIKAKAVDLQFSPYQSIEKTLVFKRINRLLGIPDGVQLKLTDGVLKAVGNATATWVNRLSQIGPAIAGVDVVDLTEIEIEKPLPPPESSQEKEKLDIVSLLNPPNGVEVSREQNLLLIKGNAPWAWIEGVPQKLKDLPWTGSLNIDELRSLESEKLKSISNKLNVAKIYFSEWTFMRENSQTNLEAITEDIKQLDILSKATGATVKITLIGHSDGLGNKIGNRRLRLLRAQKVLQNFTDFGVPRDLFSTDEAGEDSFLGFNPEKRKVTLSLTLSDREIKPIFSTWLR